MFPHGSLQLGRVASRNPIPYFCISKVKIIERVEVMVFNVLFYMDKIIAVKILWGWTQRKPNQRIVKLQTSNSNQWCKIKNKRTKAFSKLWSLKGIAASDLDKIYNIHLMSWPKFSNDTKCKTSHAIVSIQLTKDHLRICALIIELEGKANWSCSESHSSMSWLKYKLHPWRSYLV